MTGISRKLPDTERHRLKSILKKIVPEDAGVIIRTAAEGATEEELTRDVERLTAQWAAIQDKAQQPKSAPTLVYGEPDLAIRVVRDVFNEDFDRLIVQGDQAWSTVSGYVAEVAPDLRDRVSQHTGDGDLFHELRVDEQLTKALSRKVFLPSGGSLVIDRTEAMSVVDVNTGKFIGAGGNLEQTVTRNNLEAAEEIVRQLRLRDIGGIIVIDFIDMVLESNRDLVLRRLIECLARDRTKHQVAEVTSLGLVQMTRKRVGSGLLAAFSVPCEHCNGRGIIVSTDLTDLPHAHGRNGQPAATPKPGPARSRSARSKAIAQVAAKTIESEAARPDGAAKAPAEAGAPADPPAALAAAVEPESAMPESAVPEVAVVSAGSDGAAPDRDSAAGAAAVASEAGQADLAAATEGAARRRPRRSAHREAGPPDSVRAATTATPAADALPGAGAPADATSASAPGDGPAATEAGEDQEAGGSPSASPAE